jgi:DNA-binding PadR family transcriptional regulator
MTTLRNAGFIKERQDERNRREKAYRITEMGETAFRFYADPAVNSQVKMVLDDLESGPGR